MKRRILASLVAAAILAATAVPALAAGNTGNTLTNYGTYVSGASVCVNGHAQAASGSDDVSVNWPGCTTP